MLIFSFSACSLNPEQKKEQVPISIYTYLKEHNCVVDTTANLFISGFNTSDCLTCYGAIDVYFQGLITKYQVPKQNIIAIFPNSRKIETDHFFGNMIQLKRNDFAGVLIGDTAFSKMLTQVGVDKPIANNVAIIISPKQKVLLSGLYRFLGNKE